jgi:ADP-ribose pyrophosphatase YjhB (NUDIX family)
MRLYLKFLYRLRELFWKIRKPVTLGAHAIVLKKENVLLVRLSYYDGWFLPGGAVDRGESFEEAAKRELSEECGIKAQNTKLQGIYLNRNDGKINHVAVYVVEDFSGELKKDAMEIEEIKFFSTEQLPGDLRAGHRRRIEEYLGKRKLEVLW